MKTREHEHITKVLADAIRASMRKAAAGTEAMSADASAALQSAGSVEKERGNAK